MENASPPVTATTTTTIAPHLPRGGSNLSIRSPIFSPLFFPSLPLLLLFPDLTRCRRLRDGGREKGHEIVPFLDTDVRCGAVGVHGRRKVTKARKGFVESVWKEFSGKGDRSSSIEVRPSLPSNRKHRPSRDHSSKYPSQPNCRSLSLHRFKKSPLLNSFVDVLRTGEKRGEKKRKFSGRMARCLPRCGRYNLSPG